MMYLRRQILLQAFKLFDLLVVVFSFASATFVVNYQADVTYFMHFLSLRIKIVNFGLFLGFLIAWYIIFSVFGLYHSRRLSTRLNEIRDLVMATSCGTLMIFLVSIVFSIEMITPLFLVVFWDISSAITILSRLVLRYVLGWIRLHGRNLRHLVIVGTNPRAIEFAKKIESKPELGYRIIGFVDNEWSGIQEFQKNGYRLVSNLSLFPDFIREHVVDEVAISLPVRSFYSQISQIVTRCG